jgi:hypothetical protein
LGSLLVLFIVLILLIRLPTVQGFITKKATTYISSKTHTKVQLGKLYIDFPKSVVVENLFAEDTRHDTLLFLGKLKVNINMIALLKNKVEVISVSISDVNANIQRTEVDSTYNFGFLIKAFASNKKNVSDPEVKTQTDTSAAWHIQVDELQLDHIRGSFADGVSGTTVQGHVGALKLDMKGMDIKHLSFTGRNLYLADAAVSIVQNRDNDAVRDSTVSLLPSLALEKLNLERVSFSYKHIPRGQSYDFQVTDLLILPTKIDLNEHVIAIKSIYISGSTSQIALRRDTLSKHTTESSDTSHVKGWYVSADSIDLAHINFAFDETNVKRIAHGVDYMHLKLTNVNSRITKTSYSPDRILANIQNISLKEQSGFDLIKLSADGEYNNHGGHLKDFVLITSHSNISKSDLAVTYPSIRSLSEDIGELAVQTDMHAMQVGVEDILLFAPQLSDQFAPLADKKILVSGKVNGKLKDITASNLTASLGNNTSVSLDGNITGLPKARSAVYDIDIKNANSTKSDLMLFLKDKLPASIDIPQTFAISGHVKGSMAAAKADLNLKTSSGDVIADVSMRAADGDTQYAVKLNATALDLGYILKNKDLGTITAQVNGTGQNFALSTIIADAKAHVNEVTYRKYAYRDISIDACASNGAYDAQINIADTNAQMNLQAALLLLPGDRRVQATANIIGIDLQKTHLMTREIRTGAKLTVNLRDSSKNINGNADIRDLIVLRGQDYYHIDSITMLAKSDTGHLHFTLTSDLANADYNGTSKVQLLPKSLTTYINSYFSITENKPDTKSIDSSGQEFKLTANVNPHPIITEVFLPQVKNFNGASVTADFDKDKRKLNVELAASAMAYGGVKVENISASIHSVNDSLKYSASISHLVTGPVKLTETALSGSLKENRIAYMLDIKDSVGGDKLKTSGEFKQPDPKAYTLHIDSNGLILNNRKWNLAYDNMIKFGSDGLNIHEFTLDRFGQRIAAASQSDQANSPVKIDFKDFNIGTLSQIIEADTALLRGYMNGSVELRNLSGTPAFVSDLRIDSISYQQHPIGDLTVKADNLSANRYQAAIKLTGADNNVEVNGAYITAAAGNQLDLKAEIHKLNFQSIEPFTAGQIRRSKGYLTGTMALTGTTSHPLINGEVSFRDAACNVAYINNYITIKEDKIRIDPKGIYFSSFDILDSLGQKATIDGTVHTTDFKKMKFDLSIRTDDFTVLNTTIEDNPLYFGKVLLSSKISVRGDESLPVVNADIKLLNSTNVSVVIPGSKISTDRGDGIVVLVDHTDTTGILGRKRDTLSTKLQFKGINLISNIEIAKQAHFKVIVDKTSGDSLVVNGEGRLSFAIDPSGNQNLTGTYTLDGGSYVFTFEKLIHKRFKIRPGSTITWNGQPQDAVVDVSAIYSVRTSAADLLATELIGVSESEKNAYRKLLNFKVYLNMKGQLLKPDISFTLDMDEADKAAFSGIVYSKVASVNQNPDVLNKQVFALLILNKFIPTSTVAGDDYGTMATNVARNSVNQVLTDQLNSLSGKYIKGVDLNFGLASNDEYSQGGVQQNTQVSIGLRKNFFKDRLGVQVGTSINVPNSNSSAAQYNASNITGDILIDYKLTTDGRFHFKAFRLNQYEGIIDGLLYKTGISLLYNKDYNTLRELFSRRIKTPEPKPEEKKSE